MIVPPPIGRTVHLVAQGAIPDVPDAAACVEAQVIEHCDADTDDLSDCLNLRRLDNRAQQLHIPHDDVAGAGPRPDTWHLLDEHR